MHSKIFAKILAKIPALGLAVATGAALAVAGFGAQAMPAGSVSTVSAAPQITLAAQGCGPGFARGPYGGCRPIARGPVVVVPARPVVVVPRGGCGVRVGPVGVRTPC